MKSPLPERLTGDIDAVASEGIKEFGDHLDGPVKLVQNGINLRLTHLLREKLAAKLLPLLTGTIVSRY